MFDQRIKWLTKYGKNGDKQPNLYGHIVITGVSLFVISLLACGLYYYADTKAKEWLRDDITKYDTDIKTDNLKIFYQKPEKDNPKNSYLYIYSKCGYTLKDIKKNVPAITITDYDVIRLQEQCQDIEKRIEAHKKVTIYLYKISYASIFTRNILVILGGACVFFISKEGWDKANNVWINLFIVFSLTSLFLTQDRLVFQDNANLKANRDLYVAYTILYNKLLTYSATGQVSRTSEDIKAEDTIKPIDPKTFIHYIDSNIAKIYQVSLSWNLEDNFQIQDVIKQINADSGLPKNN